MKTTFVEVNAPKWVNEEHVRIATKHLITVMSQLKGKDEAMRGYIWAANKDGFPVRAGFATTEQLEDICIRAFWFGFERVCKEKDAALKEKQK